MDKCIQGFSYYQLHIYLPKSLKNQIKKMPIHKNLTNFFTFMLIILILTLTSAQSSKLQTQHTQNVSAVSKQETKYFTCKDVEHTEDYYLCALKQQEWVLKQVDVEYERDLNVVKYELEGDDEFRQRVRSQIGQIFFILAKVKENQQLQLSYIGLQQKQGMIGFKSITIPDSLQPLQSQLPNILHNQIKDQFGRFRSDLGKQAIVLVIVLIVFIGFIYWFKRGKMESTIDKQPTELKEVLNAKMEIQKEENRVPSAGMIRSSQPPRVKPKI